MSGVTPISFVDGGLGNSSYLVQLGDHRALVVDPTRHPDTYLAEAERRGLSIAYAAETHLHADFVSGGRELSALGAALLAPAAGGHEFPVRGLSDGEDLDLGGLTLRALATPGHTPEHLAYLVLDGATPLALFSGGSLLVDAVARTDLTSPDQTEPLARSLWRSIQERLLPLPDDLPVFPTHGAGSFCSSPAGGERTTTIGRERRANPLLAAPDEDTFVRLLLDGLGSYPPYFLRLRDVNRRGAAIFGPGTPTLARLDGDAVRHRVAAGAVLVDLRSVEAFARGHIPGSLSIALRDVFATWLGWLVPDATPIVFVSDDTAGASRAAIEARKVGYDLLEGVVDVADWDEPLAHTALRPAEAAAGTIVDVRQRNEFDAGHIPGAVHVELGDIAPATVPRGPVSVMCGHGERAMSAASVLERDGHGDVTVLTGGPAEWSSARGESLATS